MVQLTRIYTKGGDKGKTSLGDGSRVSKNAARIQAIGAVDECNSVLGVAALYLKHVPLSDIRRIQNDLFDLGADLCIPATENKLTVSDQQATWLEQQIDKMNEKLDPLKSFILPGGTKASAYLHHARTSVRSAERLVVGVSEEQTISSAVIQYLNRLSDYLFVAARIENNFGKNDVLWEPAKNR
ncbi:MAG: ATP:cob(I)alamin adenosyltransferase [Rickettsiales bacterium]|nr:ATP:cob(I)alamin adenosyltransferase [Rickettsiales bacterium]|tara:strand:+ start:8416 stop:8967 length:552 start_codon:yes stop_codon:yes gene_type:complete